VSRRLIVWLLISLAIHAGLAGATVAALRGAMPPMLFVDLVHGLLLASDEPAVAGRAGASPARPAPSAPARSRVARGRRDVTAPPRSAPAPPEVPAETPLMLTPPASPPSAVPESAPMVAEPSPMPVPPPTAVAPPASVESATPSLAAPTGPPASGPDGAPPSGDSGGGQGQPLAGTGAAAGRDSASDGAAGSGSDGRDASALALAIPSGTGTGEAAEYAGYYALLRRRVFESLTYPPVARRRSLSGTVQLELEIQPTGVISRVEVAASSSHRVLDDAAVDTVRNVGRVPFPPDLRPRVLRVRLPVVFALR
jgi:TonB family protein